MCVRVYVCLYVSVCICTCMCVCIFVSIGKGGFWVTISRTMTSQRKSVNDDTAETKVNNQDPGQFVSHNGAIVIQILSNFFFFYDLHLTTVGILHYSSSASFGEFPCEIISSYN